MCVHVLCASNLVLPALKGCRAAEPCFAGGRSSASHLRAAALFRPSPTLPPLHRPPYQPQSSWRRLSSTRLHGPNQSYKLRLGMPGLLSLLSSRLPWRQTKAGSFTSRSDWPPTHPGQPGRCAVRLSRLQPTSCVQPSNTAPTACPVDRSDGCSASRRSRPGSTTTEMETTKAERPLAPRHRLS